MLRYLGVSVAIGLLVSLLVGAFGEAGLFGYFGDLTFSALAGAPLVTLPDDADVSRWLQYPALLVVALAVGWTSVDIEGGRRKALVAGCAAVLLCGLAYTLAVWGALFEPLTGVLAVAGAYAAGALHARSRGGSKQRRFVGLLRGRVSPAVLNSLVAEPARLKLGGSRRELSVVVVRVTNAAELAATLAPAELAALCNRVHETAAAFLVERGGYLESVGAEGVRVVFGAPFSGPHHAPDACRAALGLQLHARSVAHECEGRWLRVPEFGIGVMSGALATGVFGAPGLEHFGVLGSETEFARRLAGANRSYGSTVLVGAPTQRLAEADIEVRPMEMLFEPEGGVMIEVYELLGMAGALSAADAASRDSFWQGVVHLRQGLLEEAMRQFNDARREGILDPPLDYYISKVDWLLSHPDKAGEFHDQPGAPIPGARPLGAF